MLLVYQIQQIQSRPRESRVYLDACKLVPSALQIPGSQPFLSSQCHKDIYLSLEFVLLLPKVLGFVLCCIFRSPTCLHWVTEQTEAMRGVDAPVDSVPHSGCPPSSVSQLAFTLSALFPAMWDRLPSSILG